MYAIIETGGKQIRVEEGASIFVEKLAVNEGEAVVFDKVLLVGGDETKVGQPYVEGCLLYTSDPDTASSACR